MGHISGTEAIKVCPVEAEQDLATFYHNRAAAYEKLVCSISNL
jgi:hypothetical protein